MTDAAAIAAKLTKAQRELMLFFPAGSMVPAYCARDDYDGRLAALDIKRMKGLFEKHDIRGSQKWWYSLTPLGLAVRAILLEQTP